MRFIDASNGCLWPKPVVHLNVYSTAGNDPKETFVSAANLGQDLPFALSAVISLGLSAKLGTAYSLKERSCASVPQNSNGSGIGQSDVFY